MVCSDLNGAHLSKLALCRSAAKQYDKLSASVVLGPASVIFFNGFHDRLERFCSPSCLLVVGAVFSDHVDQVERLRYFRRSRLFGWFLFHSHFIFSSV